MTQLVTFGEAVLRLSPPQTARLETTERFDVWTTGAASNVAVTASRLGTDATWVSKLADTPLGRRAVSELRGHGLSTEVTWADADESRQGLTFYEHGVEPRESVTVDDRDGTAIGTAEPGGLPMDTVQNAEAVFASGETLALSDTVVETTEAVLRATSGTSVLGLDYRPGQWSAEEARETVSGLFPAVDVFVTNVDEAQRVLKQTGKPAEIAHQLANEGDFETVVMTRGEHGALVWHDATIHEQDAVATDAVDVTGQHDAFVGAFLGRRLAGDAIGAALSHGVAAAALSRTVYGPVPTIDPSEVEQVVGDLTGDSPGSSGGPLR
ncbi:sugar kinase [Halorientalis halophila]|uniref:sugar kinase n=1 Tax=Halorientalis halophila TaxID=3108499 RepID=UPI00300BC60A